MKSNNKIFPERNLVIGIMLIGLLVRMRGMIDRSLWWDEFVSIDFALMKFPVEIIMAIYKNVNPPLFYLILSVWMKAFGQNDVILRTLPFIFAAATLPVFYITMRKLLGRNEALLSLLFLALNPFHVFYSIEVRMYALTVFCTVTSLWFLHAWLETPSRKNSAGLILVNVIGLYIHYFYIPVYVAQVLYFMMVAWKHRGLIVKWVVVQCTTILLFVPWFPAMYYQYKGPVYGHFKVFNPRELWGLCLQIAPGSCLMYGNPEIITAVIACILAIAGIFIVLIRGWRSGELRGISMLFCLLVPVFIVWVQSMSKPAYTQRNMIVIVPFFLTVMAAGVFRLPGKYLKFIVSGILVAAGILSILQIESWHRDDHLRGNWKKAAAIIKHNLKNDDIVFLYPGDLQSWGINYYYPELKPVPHVFEPFRKSDRLESPETLLAKINKLGKPDTTVWLVLCGYKQYKRWKNVLTVLDQNLTRTHFDQLYNVRIYRYKTQ